MEVNKITEKIIKCAIKVQTALGRLPDWELIRRNDPLKKTELL
jgi:hypothetical protein